MKRALLAFLILIAFLWATSAQAATSIYADLTGATGITRTVDASLTTYAQQRAQQITTDFSHDGWCGCTAEVLAWNSGFPDPLAEAVLSWMASPDHRAILSDKTLTLIGCGTAVSGNRTYIACELRHGSVVQPQLPNTAFVGVDMIAELLRLAFLIAVVIIAAGLLLLLARLE